MRNAGAGRDNKTRRKAGSGLMLDEEASDARRSGVNRPPSPERSVIAAFPVDKFRKHLDAWFEIEREDGLVLKAEVYGEIVGRDGELDFRDRLAFCLGEAENTLIRALFGTLGLSHISPFFGR